MSEQVSLPSGSAETDIAIVGLAGRFPGARSVEEFWTNLRNGVESATLLTDEQLRAAGVSEELIADPNYVRAAYPLPDMDAFDAKFFGFAPSEAAIMDPQQRHFLELAWTAMEHAGHAPERFEGSVGVFAGCGASAYLMFNLLTNPELVESVGFFLLRHTGNDKDLATRASYLMNLRGPSVNVQTACSTSLVAIHMAAQSLLNHECDLALAGGSTVKQPHDVGYLYKEGEIMAPDGHCRAFDAKAEGTVFGSGSGVVVLRRLADAIRDGDTIHAVIKGSAINNDGAQKVGFLAPSP
jgi:acyl transferase domain-containing protein